MRDFRLVFGPSNLHLSHYFFGSTFGRCRISRSASFIRKNGFLLDFIALAYTLSPINIELDRHPGRPLSFKKDPPVRFQGLAVEQRETFDLRRMIGEFSRLAGICLAILSSSLCLGSRGFRLKGRRVLAGVSISLGALSQVRGGLLRGHGAACPERSHPH